MKQYQACVATGACKPAADVVVDPEVNDHKWNRKWAASCSAVHSSKLEHPINCIDWDQARTYCDAMKTRLPTEAEWEFAARGTDGREYPWGKDNPTTKLANVCDGECAKLFAARGEAWDPLYSASDGWASTAPVGSFAAGASPFGILDMAGNVAEWVSDWDAQYTTNEQTNPKGPQSGTKRVTRGGDWQAAEASSVITSRCSSTEPHARLPTIGFRCAR